MRNLNGALFGIAAVCIWAAWIVITRLGVTTSLTVYDVAMLRFGTAGILLLPVVIRYGLALDRLGWPRLLVLIGGAGAPFVIVASTGLRYATAAHAGVLIPGMMPLFVALLAALFLRERFTRTQIFGYCTIVIGVILTTTFAPRLSGDDWTPGYLFFSTAALMWACYTIVLRHARLTSLHATALVAVGSGVAFLPFYFVVRGLNAPDAPVWDLAFQAIFQGVGVSILATFFFGKAVTILGASTGAAFSALTPAIAALVAIAILGEVPLIEEWSGILAVSVGVYLTSGGTFWGWHRRKDRLGTLGA